jgi:hypothetical protein
LLFEGTDDVIPRLVLLFLDVDQFEILDIVFMCGPDGIVHQVSQLMLDEKTDHKCGDAKGNTESHAEQKSRPMVRNDVSTIPSFAIASAPSRV